MLLALFHHSSRWLNATVQRVPVSRGRSVFLHETNIDILLVDDWLVLLIISTLKQHTLIIIFPLLDPTNKILPTNNILSTYNVFVNSLTTYLGLTTFRQLKTHSQFATLIRSDKFIRTNHNNIKLKHNLKCLWLLQAAKGYNKTLKRRHLQV